MATHAQTPTFRQKVQATAAASARIRDSELVKEGDRVLDQARRGTWAVAPGRLAAAETAVVQTGRSIIRSPVIKSSSGPVFYPNRNPNTLTRREKIRSREQSLCA